MSDQKTTIIIGAGASVHYGFPTGDALIDSIIKSAKFHNWYMIGGEYHLSEIWQAAKFSKLLKNYDPISVDRFLSMYSGQENHGIVAIGKKLIAHEIVKRQKFSHSTRQNRENWYKYLYDFVFADNDYETKLDNDEFRIITFNYDLSLEHFFDARLEKTPFLSKEEAWKIFLKFNSKIHHVYGSVYDYTRISESGSSYCDETSEERYTCAVRYAEKANHSAFQETSVFHNNIKVIGEERGSVLSEALKDFKSHLQQSHRVFVLGFGFDDINMGLIGLNSQHIRNFRKTLFCTNYNDNNIINEKLKTIVANRHNLIKSDKTVYGALTEDFIF